MNNLISFSNAESTYYNVVSSVMFNLKTSHNKINVR